MRSIPFTPYVISTSGFAVKCCLGSHSEKKDSSPKAHPSGYKISNCEADTTMVIHQS